MMLTFLIIILILILFGAFIMLYKYINFLMYYFYDDLQTLKKNINYKEPVANKTPTEKYYCPDIFKSKVNECIYDNISNKHKCSFKKWGFIFESPPGCCQNKCSSINNNSKQITENTNKNKKQTKLNNKTNTTVTDNINNNIIEPFDNKYWCYKSNNKCIEKEYNPLNKSEMSCGTNMLNNQLSKIYMTETECLRDYNNCDGLDINNCLLRSECGWCANKDGGSCVSGNPTEPNDMHMKCNPYMYREIK